MQRPGGLRNYSPSPANSTGGLFTTKSGAIDRHKLALVLICAALVLWVVYDACCHLHKDSFERAVRSEQRDMTKPGLVGDAQAVGGVLRAPGSAEGKLPTSLMFRTVDYRTTSFFSAAGVLANPIQAEHLVSKQMNGLHMATIIPGQTRGNHLHEKSKEVLVLVHGRFLLRVAMLGNDGKWLSEDHLFDVGVPANPFSRVASIVSSAPIGLELPPDVCHALRNVDESTTAFFASYFVRGMDEPREEPNRAICKAHPEAFLP